MLDLPQETADSAAQMRRVIVDQIEALAELNRIVARHGRGIEPREPVRRPSLRLPTPAARHRASRKLVRRLCLPSLTGAPASTARRSQIARPAAAPRRFRLRPPWQGNGPHGWLSELLHRASQRRGSAAAAREDATVPASGSARAGRNRHTIESLTRSRSTSPA